MKITDKLNNLFIKAKQQSGLIPIQRLEEITLNHRLIREIAHKHGFYTAYKPRSHKIVGYGDYRHSNNWSNSPTLRSLG